MHSLINAIWLVIGLWWAFTALRTKRAVKAQKPSSRLVPVALLASGAMLLFSPWPAFDSLGWRWLAVSLPTAVLGLLLTAVGALLAIAARTRLGGNWSAAAVIKEGHELVSSGPYAWVRHPMYCGAFLAAAGTAFASGELRGVIALPLLLTGFWLKARAEERLLEQEFGARYDAYRHRVPGRILPAIL
ncbi:MAG TPA: isoprenylcysteine carboxylmethyltransferase family protein [Steroidobacteraceae bacterium]